MSMKRGQVTFVNIIAFFITLIMFFVMYPIIDTMIEAVIAGMTETEYTPLISMALRLILFVIPLSLMITILNYANPPAGARY
jgi:hypothetical protein